MDSKIILTAFKKTVFSFQASLPILIGLIILLGMAEAIVPSHFYTDVFTHNNFFDPFIGAFIGSFMAGSPITSYIIGGEFLHQGVSVVTVVAFIISWTTVGLFQMPLEATFLGWRFTLWRALIAFLSAIVVGAILELILRLLL